MLKNLKKRRAQLYARGELAEAQAYNFFPVSFEMPKVLTHVDVPHVTYSQQHRFP